jgi:hypothetical protein
VSKTSKKLCEADHAK